MNNILDVINESNSILLLTHENPDGDAVGSVMALYYVLTNMNKDVDFIILNIPPVFSFLPSINRVVDRSDKKYDLGIVLDCSSKERIASNNGEFDRCKRSIVIDHHVSNTNYGDINYVEHDTSSCAQILYYLFKNWNVKFTKEIAMGLLTGVLTDTNGYGNIDVDKNTFLMTAELLDTGVDFNMLYYNVLSKKNMAQHLLAKMTMDRLEFFEDGKIAFSYISKEDFVNVGAKTGDHEGLVNIGRNICGVEISIFVREDDYYYISFRSNSKIKVNEIASRFGGGGHPNAGGAKIKGEFLDIKNRLINETIKELNK